EVRRPPVNRKRGKLPMYLNGTGPNQQDPTPAQTILANEMLMQVITTNLDLLHDPDALLEGWEPDHTPAEPLDLASAEVTEWLTLLCDEVTNQFARECPTAAYLLEGDDPEDADQAEDQEDAPTRAAEPETPSAGLSLP